MSEKIQYIIAGNWKMHKTVAESQAFITGLDERVREHPGIEVLIFPPYTSLFALRELSEKIKIGSQNMFYEEQGAYTGEISPLMLKDLVEYVLIGHSERRHVFNETDEEINKKVRMALQSGFRVILCVGETLKEREGEQTFERIKSQIETGLEGVDRLSLSRLSIAYEPVWAIGTGKVASPDQAQEVHAFIRGELTGYTDNPADLRILYGGSVKAENSFDILSRPDINGVLVGGASLNVDAFSGIIDHSYKLIDA
jgi:triosephosphate isomerase